MKSLFTKQTLYDFAPYKISPDVDAGMIVL